MERPRCTNDLVLCTHDDCGAPLFRYALGVHLRTVHGVHAPDAVVVADDERAYVNKEGQIAHRRGPLVRRPPQLPARKRRKPAAATAAAGAKRAHSPSDDGAPTDDECGADSGDYAGDSGELGAVTRRRDAVPAGAAGARSRVPVAEREHHVCEWSVYANTDDFERDMATLLQHVSEAKIDLATLKRAAIVAKLRGTADTLQETLDALTDAQDDELGWDVGLDSETQRESLSLHIALHRQLAVELEGRTFDSWRRSIAEEPRTARRPRV